MEKGLISVIVPVYNVEAYLEECVNSILAQTHKNLELLLVNDGSKDSSGAICDRYAAADSRVRVIHKENEGPSRTRSRGIDESKGEYIVFVDSDDKIRPNMLAEMLRVMTRYRTDLVISGYEKFRGDWTQPVQYSTNSLVIFQGQKELANLYNKPGTNLFGISIWAKLYRAEIIRKYNIRFRTDMDYEEDCMFNLDYFRHIGQTAVLRDVFYSWRQMDQSLSKGYRKKTFPSLIIGYKGRKQYMSELKIPSGGVDAILMLVVKTTLQKIFDSNLPMEEKLQEYASVIAFEESRFACEKSAGSKVRMTREICKAVCDGNAKKVHSVLKKWNRVNKCKDKVKRVLNKILRRK